MQYTINNPVTLLVTTQAPLAAGSALSPYTSSVTRAIDDVISTTAIPGAQASTLGTVGTAPVLYVNVFTFIPTVVGKYNMVLGEVVIPTFEVVAKTSLSILTNLEDEALGSWRWDKSTGSLTLLRQSGTPLATFNAVDTQTLATRERIG